MYILYKVAVQKIEDKKVFHVICLVTVGHRSRRPLARLSCVNLYIRVSFHVRVWYLVFDVTSDRPIPFVWAFLKLFCDGCHGDLQLHSWRVLTLSGQFKAAGWNWTWPLAPPAGWQQQQQPPPPPLDRSSYRPSLTFPTSTQNNEMIYSKNCSTVGIIIYSHFFFLWFIFLTTLLSDSPIATRGPLKKSPRTSLCPPLLFFFFSWCHATNSAWEIC